MFPPSQISIQRETETEPETEAGTAEAAHRYSISKCVRVCVSVCVSVLNVGKRILWRLLRVCFVLITWQPRPLMRLQSNQRDLIRFWFLVSA